MVEFYLLTFPRFPLRKKERKSYFGKNRTHDFRTSRCAGYLLDHSVRNMFYDDDGNTRPVSATTVLGSEVLPIIIHRRRCQKKNTNASKPCINKIELLIELLIDHPPSQGGGCIRCYNVKTSKRLLYMYIYHSYTSHQPIMHVVGFYLLQYSSYYSHSQLATETSIK